MDARKWATAPPGRTGTAPTNSRRAGPRGMSAASSPVSPIHHADSVCTGEEAVPANQFRRRPGGHAAVDGPQFQPAGESLLDQVVEDELGGLVLVRPGGHHQPSHRQAGDIHPHPGPAPERLGR